MLRRLLVFGLLLGLVGAVAGPTAADEGDLQRGPLTIVGDLDGDGVPDAVRTETRVTRDLRVAYTSESALVAVSGRDGSTLWSRPIPGSVLIERLDLGNGRNGVLAVYGPAVDGVSGVVGAAVLGNAGGGVLLDVSPLILRAFGGDGDLLWDHTYDSGSAFGAAGQIGTSSGAVVAASEYAAFVATLDPPPGAATGVVLSVNDRFNTPMGYTSATTAVVLDGASGELRWERSREASEAAPRVRAAGDLYGDGTTDVVFVDIHDGGGVVAHRGTDGEELWTNPDVGVWDLLHVDPLGDLDGDGRGELSVSSVREPFTADQQYANHVLDGASGAVRFTTDASLTPVGDATGDGRTEVVAIGPGEDGEAEYRVLDADGQTRAGPAGEPSDVERPATTLAYAGDVDGDGVTDLLFSHRSTSSQGPERLFATTVLSGSTLQPIRTSEDREVPTGATLTAGGDDTLRIVGGDDEVTLAALDGASGAQLWTRTVAHPVSGGDSLGVRVDGADLDGDGIPDLLVQVETVRVVCMGEDVPSVGCIGGQGSTAFRSVVALSGATGAVLWEQ